MNFYLTKWAYPPEEGLNNSIQNLEFNLANTINKLTVSNKPKVAFTKGHGELSLLETADVIAALSEYYALDTVWLNGRINSLTTRQQNDSGVMAVQK